MSSTPNVPSTYLSLQQAAADGYAAYSTLRAYVKDGRLPAVRIGRRLKVRREDLDALAQSARQTASRDAVAAIQRIVDDAPPLTQNQRERLAVILGGGS